MHDLRRTAVTGMAEIGMQPHVIEAVVNHVSGHKGGIAGVYNRATTRPKNERRCRPGRITCYAWRPIRRFERKGAQEVRRPVLENSEGLPDSRVEAIKVAEGVMCRVVTLGVT